MKTDTPLQQGFVAELKWDLYEAAPPALRSQMLSASPVMAGSAAAAVLVTVLMRRSRSRRAEDSVTG